MTFFSDADEVYKYIGGLFRAAVADPAMIAATKDSGLVIKLIQSEPECQIVVDFSGGKVLIGAETDGVPSTVQLTMASDTAHLFWLGKLNFVVAMGQKKVKLEGKKSAALKLMPLASPLFAQYAELLRVDGRDDLLVD